MNRKNLKSWSILTIVLFINCTTNYYIDTSEPTIQVSRKSGYVANQRFEKYCNEKECRIYLSAGDTLIAKNLVTTIDSSQFELVLKDSTLEKVVAVNNRDIFRIQFKNAGTGAVEGATFGFFSSFIFGFILSTKEGEGTEEMMPYYMAYSYGLPLAFVGSLWGSSIQSKHNFYFVENMEPVKQ